MKTTVTYFACFFLFFFYICSHADRKKKAKRLLLTHRHKTWCTIFVCLLETAITALKITSMTAAAAAADTVLVSFSYGFKMYKTENMNSCKNHQKYLFPLWVLFFNKYFYNKIFI